MFPRQKDIDRFWLKVDIKGSDECWNWTGNIVRRYGQFSISTNKYRSNRFVWIITYGEIPEGLWVLHRCDNTKCCNPRHLFLGTHQDNMDDMFSKGRNADHSEQLNGMAKLTVVDVLEIRRRLKLPFVRNVDLAKEFCVSKSCISEIKRGKNWRMLDVN